MTITSADKKQFQQKVLERYEANKRDLPWRQTKDPYKIMVSEFMLQQTQVPRVIQKFTRWMELWPTVQDLANASRPDVLREWSGLGFNRRAINLHEAAKKIAAAVRPVATDIEKNKSQSDDAHKVDNQGPVADLKISNEPSVADLMSDYAFLRTLPGVGEYTANAVLAFAYNQEVPVMDINIKRVLLHTFELPIDMPLFELQELALSLVPVGKSRDWHNALMDYGSQVLHSKATGIRSAKQSKFAGSDREVRGWILKQLAIQPTLSMITIANQRPDKNVETIVVGLCKEGILSKDGELVFIKE